MTSLWTLIAASKKLESYYGMEVHLTLKFMFLLKRQVDYLYPGFVLLMFLCTDIEKHKWQRKYKIKDYFWKV
jgi:cell division protein FtsW (lipid II flippase)